MIFPGGGWLSGPCFDGPDDLVEALRRNLAADPLDGPVVYLEADVMADDMARYAATADDPLATG